MQVKSELKLIFTGLLTQYPGVGKVFDSLWKEIVDSYTEARRHYHTLHHLRYIYNRLEECPQKAQDREALLFSLFYHDLVYEIPANDNEEKSAAIAADRMQALGITQATIDLCVKHILATKNHLPSPNADTNLFCDADMAILGETPDKYKEYTMRIRAEYEIISDTEFMKKRAEALSKLLGMERLFKTDHFFRLYEKPARNNMEDEIKRLSQI